ncbi:ankyrin repeat-containing protein [Verticillium alfalfae VaMs.102]|uniref:Ankyrin repeat-containing protein n=1 Tax=Verticillium alfalfae (strain VaMs.102 / ATCC MYA-4576 / FGSC 10136) TaxID=526221 RepID=C9SJW0_VERA1|nr:ankyrin repeat-containing protein [Verticillium alfalfae VaMs.102]EEY18978.1 ankyrin repeat-containing protein [Verticillium alfalfae VaMs.102]
MDEQQAKFALHAAAREGKVSLAEAILKTDPKLAARVDDDGRMPIHWAVSANQIDIVVLLTQLRGFDPDVQDGSGWSPVMIAGSLPDGDAVMDVFLSRGADINLKNLNGQNVLHFIASKNNLDLAKRLLALKTPVSARVRDKRGQYAIHRASAVGSVPMVNLLLKHKSPLDATDNFGYTALHHAIAEGHGDTAVALLKAGADVSKRDMEGNLALDLAPDNEVRYYIERFAEAEGIDLLK